jgi:anti-sigma-K factor RskA
MEPESLHELAAGYALDALDDDELAAFEQHLAECEQCAADVLAFRETAALLAYAEEGPELPAALRERVLEDARRELPHQSVVVLRPRRALRLTAIAAAAAVAAAIGLGVWATSLSSSLDAERSALADSARAAAILADEGSRRLPLGAYGQVVRAPDGEAVMIVRNLDEAPSGKTYEAWVIGAGGPVKAGLFEGGDQEIVRLEEPVDSGAIVAVTLEPEGGSDQPTSDVLFGTSKA